MMTHEEKFVKEIIEYIFTYPDDDYMTMECLCRKLHKHELIAKVDGHWQPLDKRCEDCIFVEGSHWCDGCDKTPKGMKEYDEYWAKADRKTEPQTDGYMTSEQAEDYRKMLDKAEHKVYGNIEDEPQTDC